MDSELESIKKELKKIKNKIMIIDISKKVCNACTGACVASSVFYGINYIGEDIKRDIFLIGGAVIVSTGLTVFKHFLNDRRYNLIDEKFACEDEINYHCFKY